MQAERLESEADKQYISQLVGQIDEYKAELKKRGVNVVNKSNHSYHPTDPQLNPHYSDLQQPIDQDPDNPNQNQNQNQMENTNLNSNNNNNSNNSTIEVTSNFIDENGNYTLEFYRNEVR